MPTKTDTFLDVVIVGAGPVGLTLANMLGASGIKVAVLERADQAYDLPRAVTFDDDIMRIFQGMGIADEILAITELGTDAQFVDGEGNCPLFFCFTPISQSI